ncbi:hypothetical protein LTR27_006909 [Elasticomyces elasticus]|nr:hypothetical protein LTR27_006909 [Elasticomyces elasticus]
MSTTRDTVSKSTEMSTANPRATSIVPQVCGMCGSSAKLNCSRCHHILYCSKECQIKDWRVHKSVCKFLGRPLGNLPHIVTYDQASKVIDNDKAFFQAVLVISDSKIPDPTRNTHRFSGTFLHVSNFGGMPPMEDAPVGAVLLARRDGRHVQTLQVVAVADFLREVADQMAAFADQEEADGENIGEGTVKRAAITPAAFTGWFKAMKEKAVADGDTAWTRVECPVLVEED